MERWETRTPVEPIRLAMRSPENGGLDAFVTHAGTRRGTREPGLRRPARVSPLRPRDRADQRRPGWPESNPCRDLYVDELKDLRWADDQTTRWTSTRT